MRNVRLYLVAPEEHQVWMRPAYRLGILQMDPDDIRKMMTQDGDRYSLLHEWACLPVHEGRDAKISLFFASFFSSLDRDNTGPSRYGLVTHTRIVPYSCIRNYFLVFNLHFDHEENLQCHLRGEIRRLQTTLC